MKECLCGAKAVYVCKPCKAAFCKDHKIVHENGRQRVHNFEKIGKKLNSELLTVIINDLSSKIQITNQCEKIISDETKRLIAKIQDMHMNALNIIKQKQQRFTMLLINCQKRLRDDELKEIEQELMKTLVIENSPPYKFEESINFFNLDFLKETQKIDQISSMPIAFAKIFLEEYYGLFLETHTCSVKSIVITNGNSHIISSSNSDTIRFWNLQTRTQEAPLRTSGVSILSLAVTSDSKYIVSGCSDNTVRIWNFQERTCEIVLEGHTDTVLCVSVSRDSTYIASASKDTTVIIWSLQHRQQVVVLEGHSLEVLTVCLSRDNKYIVSGSEDMTVRVWNLQRAVE